jgi:hypothetical protein
MLSDSKELLMNRPLSWFSRSKSDAPRPSHRARPVLEELEQRQVPTVYYHGGALLRNVEVQPIYLGSDWSGGATYQTAVQLQGFLSYIVQSPYMDMLTNAGYAVGRGSTNAGIIQTYNFNKSQWLTDDAIRTDLQTLVNGRYVPGNDANRLYVLFIEPGVAVWAGGHSMGYHNAVNGMAYAVVPFPGGVNALASSGLSTLGNLTAITSHELAEAVTDPLTYYNPYYRTAQSWFDDYYGYYYHGSGEIGDIVNLNQRYPFVLLNNYIVQKEAGQNDQPLSPAGSYQLYVAQGASPAGTAFSFPAVAATLLEVTVPTGLHARDHHHAKDWLFAQGALD